MSALAVVLAVLGCLTAAVVILLSIPPVCRRFMAAVGCAIDRSTDRRLAQLGQMATESYQQHLDDLWSLSRDAWQREMQQPDTERPV